MGPIKAGEVGFFGQVSRTKNIWSNQRDRTQGPLRLIPGKLELYALSSPSGVPMPLVTKLKTLQLPMALGHRIPLVFDSRISWVEAWASSLSVLCPR